MLSKLLTLLRGHANGLAEQVVDANALRILQQELQDADLAAKAAAVELASLMAEEVAIRRRIDASTAEIVQREEQARKALEGGQAALALDVAGRIANLENDRRRDLKTDEVLAEQVATIRKALTETERRVGELRHEIVRLRAVDAVQRTEARIGRNGAEIASAVDVAEATAERIRQRQQRAVDERAARSELKAAGSPEALDGKLQHAGLLRPTLVSAEAVLERIKASVAPPPRMAT